MLFSLRMKPIILAVFLLIFANMAYVWRGRGPRTRGGTQRGNLSTRGEMRYARSDGNMFSCLRGINQDGDEGSCATSDSDETLSDKSQSIFQEVQHKKKRKFNSSSSDPSNEPNCTFTKTDRSYPDEQSETVDYETLSSEEKLNLILSKVSVNEGRFLRLEQVFDNVVKQNKRISTIESVISSHEDRIRLLEYKSIDLEARSRRNNLLFYGLKENRLEDCKDIICQFVSVELNVSINEPDISRAHRVGRFDRRRERPIIVAFESYLTTDSIIKQGFRLKDSVYSVSRDYPLEITRARRTLWPEYRRMKSEDPSARISMVYPAKLLVNGTVVRDLFPEWDMLLKGSRVDLSHLSQQSIHRNISTGTNEALQSYPISTRSVANHVNTDKVNIDNATPRMHTERQQPTSESCLQQPDKMDVSENQNTVRNKQRNNELDKTTFKAPARRTLTPNRGPVNRPSRSLSRTRASVRSASLNLSNRKNQPNSNQPSENQPTDNNSTESQSSTMTANTD